MKRNYHFNLADWMNHECAAQVHSKSACLARLLCWAWPKTTRGRPTGVALTGPGRAPRTALPHRPRAWRSPWCGRWRDYDGRTRGRSSLQASPSYAAPAWQREVDQLAAARHGDGEGDAHWRQWVVRWRWSMAESGRYLAQSCTIVAASGARHNMRRKTSFRGVLAHRRGWVVTSAATWSGGAGGPTAGMIGPRATRGPGAPLGLVHQERGTVRRAIHGGHGRRK
jgi:hypothetical protein